MSDPKARPAAVQELFTPALVSEDARQWTKLGVTGIRGYIEQLEKENAELRQEPEDVWYKAACARADVAEDRADKAEARVKELTNLREFRLNEALEQAREWREKYLQGLAEIQSLRGEAEAAFEAGRTLQRWADDRDDREPPYESFEEWKQSKSKERE
jgi:hypothetical protein